jgi:hypothetical protein
MDYRERRIIGESPPHLGGKKAYSEILPSHTGKCRVRYRSDKGENFACFPSYGIARTAAIRAIFSQNHTVDGVCLIHVDEKAETPTYSNAVDWLNSIS